MSEPQVIERGAWYSAEEELSLEIIRRILEDPPPTPSVAGWLYPGSTTTVFGEPDSGKSMLLAATTYRIVKDGGEVLWVDYEMGEARVLRRLLAFGLTPREIARSVRRIHYPIGPPPDGLIDAYAGITAALFDGFTGLLSAYDGSSNSDTDIEKVYAECLRPFAGTGTSVLSLDHVTKDKENRGRWAIGSQRKIGAPDLAYLFDVVRKFKPGIGGQARLRSSRDRDGVLDVLEFHLAGDMEWQLVDTTNPNGAYRYTGFMERISIYLEGASTPASGNQIEKDIAGANNARREALKTLISENYVQAEKGDRNSVNHSSLKPYREAEDKGNSPSSPVLASSSPQANPNSSSPVRLPPTLEVGELADGFQANGKPKTEAPRLTPEPPPEFTIIDDPKDHEWGTPE